jgi:hypothetical protein
MNWIEISDFSQITAGDIISLVIDMNGKPEDGFKYKVLQLNHSVIVLNQDKQDGLNPWALSFNTFNELSFFKKG